MTTIINPTTTPTVYTRDGRVLEAGGRLDDVTLDEVGEEAVRLGFLAVDEEPASDTAADEPAAEDASTTDEPARRARKSSA